MPRQARLDAPGLFQHVLTRGLERRVIFTDKTDYDDFLKRLETSHKKSPNQILAWALMPNHIHLLIRTGSGGLSRFMRRLMTGYAMSFNKRHKRSGYLFQGRYKSIVCDEDTYYQELIRYIHLNPLRAGIVKSLDSLNRYPYTGHSVLMGFFERSWQETGEVLEFFGSRDHYKKYVREGQKEGERPDLMGGGLLRSLGGREEFEKIRRESDRQAYDERVLGIGDFVTRVIEKAEEDTEVKTSFKKAGVNLRRIVKEIAKESGLPERVLFMRGRSYTLSRAKSALIFMGVEHMGKTVKEMAGLTRMSLAAASKARERGEIMVREGDMKQVEQKLIS